MIRHFVMCALACVLFAGLSAQAQADIVYGVDSSATITAGSTGTLTFFVEATGADVGAPVTSYAVGFTGLGAGGAVDSDITFSGLTGLNGFTVTETGTSPLFIVNGFGASATISSELNLFSIDYQIASGATEAGSFNIDVVPQSQLRDDATTTTYNVVADGVEATLSFSAVPEPSSLCLLFGVVGCAAMRRRRS